MDSARSLPYTHSWCYRQTDGKVISIAERTTSRSLTIRHNKVIDLVVPHVENGF